MIAAAVVVLVVIMGTALQLRRDLPVARLTASVAETLKIPGKLSLPWPSVGSASIQVEGLGKLGANKGTSSAPIGSVAKVMTAYLILKDHPLDGDSDEGPSITITAADVADYHARIPSGQALTAVTLGEKLSERDALLALLLPSANNIAALLAKWDSGDSETFVKKMNDTAAAMGMTDTTYTDPSGFLPSTVSSPDDQVILGAAAIKIPVFASMIALPSAKVPVAGTVKNYNGMLGEHGVFGIKTGSTDQAGGNLLFSSHLTVGDTTLTVVGAVFGQPGSNTPTALAKANAATRKLLTAVEKALKTYTVLGTSSVGEITTAWGDAVKVAPDDALRVIGWPGMSVPVKLSKSAPGSKVVQGQVVGSITASGVRVQLRATSSTTDPSLWWKLTRH